MSVLCGVLGLLVVQVPMPQEGKVIQTHLYTFCQKMCDRIVLRPQILYGIFEVMNHMTSPLSSKLLFIVLIVMAAREHDKESAPLPHILLVATATFS